MPHVVTLKTAPDNAGVVYLCTAPEMSSTMGGFGPARYVGRNPPVPDASYAIDADDLPRFRVYCTNRGVRLVEQSEDTRRQSERPAWAERPLPECRECGQPARRGARLTFCPNCGIPWEPVELGPAGMGRESAMARVVCPSCLRETLAGFSHCFTCGGRLDVDEAGPGNG